MEEGMTADPEMISVNPLGPLRAQYGRIASRAMWRDDHMRDTSVIKKHRDELALLDVTVQILYSRANYQP